MAREIEIKIWCDPCFAQDIKTEGEELPPVSAGGARPRVLAMCKEHRENLYDPFIELLIEHGVPAEQLGGRRPRKASSSASGAESTPSQATETSTGLPVACPIAGCDVSRKNPPSISKHLRQDHNTSLFEAIGGRDGTLYDIEGQPIETPRARPPRRHAS